MRSEFLFNFLLENNISFEKTYTNEYIIIEAKIILTETSCIKDEFVLELINKKNFKTYVFLEGKISNKDIKEIFNMETDYEFLII